MRSVPARKMRIELFDGEGNRYTVSFEGRVTREKAVRLLDLVELLGGVPTGGDNASRGTPINEFSKYDQVRLIVKKHFPVGWFTSREVQSVYEREIGRPASLSTVSTYLSRMTDRGILVTVRASRHKKYCMAQSVIHTEVKQTIP